MTILNTIKVSIHLNWNVSTTTDNDMGSYFHITFLTEKNEILTNSSPHHKFDPGLRLTSYRA